MRIRPVLCLLPLLCSPSALAGGYTVDRLTCLQAQDFVSQHKRYYKASTEGPPAVYPAIPVNVDPRCEGKSRVLLLIERTHDLAECLVGYECVAP